MPFSDLLKSFLQQYGVGKYPLHEFVFQESKLRELLNRHYNTEFKLPTGETPLHLAAQFGFSVVIELLTNSGADVNAVNLEQNTPLHFAVYPTLSPFSQAHNAAGDNLQCCSILLASGAQIDAANKMGMTPLVLGLKSHNEKVVKLLLESGANVLVSDSEGWTPLHYACFAARPEFVELLLARGGDKNSITNSRETPAELVTRLDEDFDSQKQAILKLLR